MKSFKLKCGNYLFLYEKNELTGLKKEIKKAWNWSIDRVWKNYRKTRNQAMRYILLDYYSTILNFIFNRICDIRLPGTATMDKIICSGGEVLEKEIDNFSKGGDKEYKEKLIPLVKKAMLAKVTNKKVKQKLGTKGEKIDFGKLFKDAD